jgi:glyoxylase-like metal-dependent hydrolase (beta-lactamase superfamily II)
MLEIKTFTFGPFFTNMYVVHNGQGNVLIIDPACSNPYEAQKLYPYVESLKSKILNPKLSLIATHGHLDHLWGAKALCEKWGTPVLMHEADIPMAERMQEQYDLFGVYRVAEAFPVESLKSQISNLKSQMSNFELLETPGHTPGSVCLYFPEDKVLFSGDTLFRMGYGRTDLPGGNWEQLCESLTRLFELPSDVRVYPGHGDPTTIGAERRPV